MRKAVLSFGLGLIPTVSLANDAKDIERVTVVSKAPMYQQALSDVLPEYPLFDETSFSADSLATLFSQSPAVNLNGQGGLLQSISIRGFSRWRIQTLLEGIPIYTERRAGTSIEFVPPEFVGQAYLTAGAASTQLGSGAMGGGIDVQLKVPRETAMSLGYGMNQSYRYGSLSGSMRQGTSDPDFSWLLSHRHANNSTDGNNAAIHDRFEQNSLVLRAQSDNSFIREGLLLMSSANNIAKASADLPTDRITLYPKNQHVVGKVSIDWRNGFFYFHDSVLDTDVTRPQRRSNFLINESQDMGARFSDVFLVDDWQVFWRAGVDARINVTAYETELDALQQLVFERSNLDAQQWQAFLAVDLERSLFDGTLATGGRIDHHSQRDFIARDKAIDNNLSGFVGYQYTLSSTLSSSVYLSSAYRVPSLTERFFDGATPRGRVQGDPNLATETARNIELALSYDSNVVSGSISLFSQSIENYIERLPVDDELLQYRNLNKAEIQGLTYQAKLQWDRRQVHWIFHVGGQWLSGRDNSGQRIADISPAQHRISLSGAWQSSMAFFGITHRQASDYLAPGELPTDTVTTLDAGASIDLSANTKMTVNLTNITDEYYVTSRDDLAPMARGRDIQIAFSMMF
ncbi:TonB-dependent receptor plug domain-containing protein [Aestuariibacter salexigens]|uniref:TonB-dependent receptor plug domain-containing protein n=1 Tax=Aestuariibacter salexigens TaxID=226010 RepID=UPI000411F25D|nr:TonB-dependent receptor [Aestuariibacter salexigens]